MEYAKTNPFHPLVSDSVISAAENAWNKTGGCKDQVGFSHPQSVLRVFTNAQIIACNNVKTDSVCLRAQECFTENILASLAGIWDVYYVPVKRTDPYPPLLDNYLNSPAVTSKIGSHAKWANVSLDIYINFNKTGDWARTAKLDLEKVINAGVRTVLYAGEADFICNYIGIEALVRVYSPHTFSTSRLSL
jgi:carboxypeptidase C (cathepsin A)